MKKTLATALTFLALAGTAVAQEAYGNYGYGSETPSIADTQGTYETQAPVAVDRQLTTSSTTQQTADSHTDAGQQVRWNQYN